MWHDGIEVGQKKNVLVFSVCMSDVTFLMPQQTQRGWCIVRTTVTAGTFDVVTCFD